MRPSTTRIRFYGTCALITFAMACAWCGEHKIILQRSYRKGMVTEETFTVENETVSGPVGSVPKQVKESITLTCRVEVKELRDGKWKQLVVTPKAVSATPTTLVQGLSVLKTPVTVTRDARSVGFARVDGKPIGDVDKALLSRFFVNPNPDSQDDVFGTGDDVAVKESWALSKPRMAKLLGQISSGMFSCKDDDTDGKMTLTRVWKTLKEQVLQVNGTITFKRIAVKGPIAEALKDPQINATFKLTFQLPEDTTVPALKNEGEFLWEASGVRRNGNQKFIVAGRMTRRHVVSIITRGARIPPSKTTKEANQ